MRVCICIWRMAVGGAERQLLYLAEGLSCRGIDVHVVTVFEGSFDAALSRSGATVHRLQASGKYDPSVFLGLSVLVRRIRPDVVQTYLTQMDLVGGIVSEVHRIPWILSERSAPQAYPVNLVHRARIAVGSRANAIIANSEAGASYWRDVAPGVPIVLIPNILPISEISDAEPALHPSIDVNDEVVLYVGRFSAEKNLAFFLEVLCRVLAAPKRRAVFCGDGPLRSRIEAKARELGLIDRVVFLGAVHDVWSWMKRSQVLVQLSTFEGHPNVVLEGAAAGIPMVLSDIRSHRDICGDDGAWYVRLGSIEETVAAVEAALTSREEALRRADNARRALLTSSADVVAMHERVYLEVAAVKQKGKNS